MVNAKRTINASVTARTIGSSRLLRGLRVSWTGAAAVASDMEPILVGPLGLKNIAGFGGACDVERKLLQDPANLEHLSGARGREQSPAEKQAVLKPDPNMAPHDGAHRDQGYLMAPGAKHRELVVAAAKQAIGGAAHDEQAFWLRPEFRRGCQERIE